MSRPAIPIRPASPGNAITAAWAAGITPGARPRTNTPGIMENVS